MLPFDAAGFGFRAGSRRSASLFLLVALLAACGGGPDGSTPPPAASSATGSVAETVPTGSAAAAAQSLGLDEVAGLRLESAEYDVLSVLDDEGGPELAAMLEALGLEPSEVTLLVAVDPEGRLAIGHWELPGANAEAILDAWAGAAGSTWERVTLAGSPALAGIGPDGGTAWATAADGVFRYISTDDRALAEAAAAP